MSNSFLLKKFLPFALLTVGGFYGMHEFRKLNYQFYKGKATVYREDLKKFGIQDKDYQSKTTISLQDEYVKMMENIDLDKWENVRGPRPWEDNTEFDEKMKKKVEERKKKLEETRKKREEEKAK